MERKTLDVSLDDHTNNQAFRQISGAHDTIMSMQRNEIRWAGHAFSLFQVISKLKFPREASTVIVAEDCVIDSIIQTFIRNGKKLTAKQRSTLSSRIPRLSLLHFDIQSDGSWKPSCASLPGLLGISPQMCNLPDVNFLIRPICDF
ncbi:unnamed protein product [Gongylonema pulchrum]|uniref:Uncharacterized protein n=1 Tax=Gongylonema pulchrum TaxID=637853 RepID=A0A183D099_9BILA|nr:unnamed protein product [Gongylonema pulchrum]